VIEQGGFTIGALEKSLLAKAPPFVARSLSAPR
jgi:hypothetical protein